LVIGKQASWYSFRVHVTAKGMKMVRRSALCLVVPALFFVSFLSPGDNAPTEALALVGGTVYTTPDAARVADAVITAAGGKITAVGKRGEVKIPKGAKVIDCSGKTVVAGFWNSHVHFIEAAWNNAANAPAALLEKQMREMLTRWGFTTVWDLGSEPGNSLALRRRVESGEVPGPRMLLAGDIFPKNGHPAYLPPEMQLPEAATPEEAREMAQSDLKMGLDGMKLFTGAYMGNKPVVNMDVSIVKAAVEVAHAQGKPAFAHPQNKVGLDNAIDGGVDVLAHTIPSTDFHYTSEELARFRAQHTALIPTLTLWTTIVNDPTVTAQIVQAGADQLKAFSSNGGVVLIGTDVGFIKIYDTSQEFEFMRRALSASEILASLTTNPAAYFKAEKSGRVEEGFDADLVVLEGDPAADVKNLAKVAYTIRAGKVIYQK
jgi:imidazolonepropionase-like amidohydrolase